jgi:hypothetical protein
MKRRMGLWKMSCVTAEAWSVWCDDLTPRNLSEKGALLKGCNMPGYCSYDTRLLCMTFF